MKVVIGVDGSAPSRSALAWGLSIARQRLMPVTLVHIVDDEWGQLGGAYADQESTDGARILAVATRWAAEHEPTVPVTEELRHGSPAWELAAAAGPDDLLVVGTHKTGFVQGRVLGTRSVVIASAAVSTVAVVPDAVSRTRTGVVVGVGGHWEPAVAMGARLAANTGMELTLLHARPAGGDDLDDARDLLQAAVTHAHEVVPGLGVRSRVSRRTPAEAILDAGRTAALLVLGPSRRDVAHGGYLGSVAHEVLLNLTTPVLVARNSVL